MVLQRINNWSATNIMPNKSAEPNAFFNLSSSFGVGKCGPYFSPLAYYTGVMKQTFDVFWPQVHRISGLKPAKAESKFSRFFRIVI